MKKPFGENSDKPSRGTGSCHILKYINFGVYCENCEIRSLRTTVTDTNKSGL